MRKRIRKRATIGFQNEHFLSLMASVTGIQPVGVLGRETPLNMTCLEDARGSLLIREIFSKYDDGSPSKEKEDTTWKRFHMAERACQDTNEWVLKTWRYSPFWARVRCRIRDLLGPFCWDRAASGFAFGPGATTRLTRQESAACYKYSHIPESTPGNLALSLACLEREPLWKRGARSVAGETGPYVKTVPGNKVICVPKNYKTDRTIAKEPCMNIFVQKGIGRMIRNRLKLVGVNLDDQTANQRGALLGSLDGSLATVDLSMASDTIALEVVKFLLPNEWLLALEQCRSPFGVLPDGSLLRYQKFSSMGNGYTFELETLIFWAIAQEVCCRYVNELDTSVLVYGDDIIIRSDKCPALLNRLWEAGFTANDSKTFSEGPYRESCGKHYFLGHDITPFYIRKPVLTVDRLFLVHNNLRRWSWRTETDTNEVQQTLRSLAPAYWRTPRLPDGYGDGAFIGAVDELQLDSHPHGWEYWVVSALSKMNKEIGGDLPDGQLIASLKKLEARSASDPNLSKVGLIEHESGIPSRDGQYRRINMLIPRIPR